MKKNILTFLFLLWGLEGFTQTLLTDQYQFNFMALNPAFAGAKENFSLNLMMGNQFNGTVRPQQVHQIFSTDGTLMQGRSGIGLQAYNQNSFNSGVNLNYAYRMKVGELFTAALGANGGLTYFPIQNGQSVGQLYSYAGLGGLINTERFFVSLSKPIAFIDKNSFLGGNKPFYTMFGVSLGDYFHTMFNLSALIQTTKSSSNNLYFSGKLWFNRKFGLGVSYRSQFVQGARDTKFLGMAEYQFAPTFRFGVSYDPKPFNTLFSNSQTNGFTPRGILQLFFRYEIIRDDKDEREIYRLKYY